MKVVWVVNTLFPSAANTLGLEAPVTGGWMKSSAFSLFESCKDLELTVIAFSTQTNCSIKFRDEYFRYYVFPATSAAAKGCTDVIWTDVVSTCKPDLMHIHGSEKPWADSLLRTCPELPHLVSIQGLISEYYKYYFGGIGLVTAFQHTTLRDLVRKDTLFNQQLRMRKHSEFEKSLLKKAKNIAGRTAWDEAHIRALNPNANYYLSNETLRPSFYDDHNRRLVKQQRSIFVSQGHYPIKGLHILIKALPYILRRYPDLTVRVSGAKLISPKHYKQSGFGHYIKHLIRKYRLEGAITFLGPINEQGMVRELQSAHICVCPSAIENSPNSIGEAQLLGTPCIASSRGGISSMIKDGETGLLYPYEDYAYLALCIERILSSDTLGKRLSEKAQIVAKKRHCPQANSSRLMDIYEQIIGGRK